MLELGRGSRLDISEDVHVTLLGLKLHLRPIGVQALPDGFEEKVEQKQVRT